MQDGRGEPGGRGGKSTWTDLDDDEESMWPFKGQTSININGNIEPKCEMILYVHDSIGRMWVVKDGENDLKCREKGTQDNRLVNKWIDRRALEGYRKTSSERLRLGHRLRVAKTIVAKPLNGRRYPRLVYVGMR